METVNRVSDYFLWMVSPWPAEGQYAAIALVMGLLMAAAFHSRSPVLELLGHINTFVHEASHAMAAALMGRSVTGIRLNLDQSGTTHTFGKLGPGTAFITFVGYPGPAILALVLGFTIWLDRPGIGLMVMILMFAGSVIAMRNLWGILVALAVTSAFAGILWLNLDWAILLFVTWWIWALAFGSMRPVLSLRRMIKMGVSEGSDADALRASTGIPAIFWCWTMMLVTAIASAGSVILVGISLITAMSV